MAGFFLFAGEFWLPSIRLCGMKKVILLICVSWLSAAVSCTRYFRPASLGYTNYQVKADQPADTTLSALLLPYSDSVNKSMNEVVGVSDVILEKKRPECTMGNFMTDAMLEMARQKFGRRVDVAFVNYGGMRLTQVAAGELTRGKIFEMMPFENMLILQEIKGSVLQEFLDHLAAWDGWPVAGMTMQIKDKKAVNVLIAGKPLDPSAVYVVANSDYVANGGDGLTFLRNISQQNIGYLVRDSFFDYIKWLKAQGKNITAKIENRVTHAE